jgi:hypothetical protein
VLKRRGWGLVAVAGLAAVAGLPAVAAGPANPAPQAQAAMRADELILQFRRPELQAALQQAGSSAPARLAAQRALDALAQRHGVALHYLQTLGVGSALVAMTPAAARPEALEARVARLAADAEVAAVEVNARMAPFTPGAR